MANKQEEQWIERFIEHGDAKLAVTEVWPEAGQTALEPDRSISSRASQLKKKLALDIDKQLRQELAGDSVNMLTIIKGIAQDSTSDTVKLNAAKDWLDRAGYKPADEVINKTEVIDPKEIEEQYQSAIQQAIQAMTPDQLQAVLARDKHDA